MAHRERLAREGAVLDHAVKELPLFHRRQQEADGIRALRQALQHILAVDIVDLPAVHREVFIQKALQHTDGQRADAGAERHAAAALPGNPRDAMALRSAAALLKRREQRLGLHTRHDAVNRLENLRVVADILQLHQRKARRIVLRAVLGGLLRLIAGFGRRQRVIAIAHGVAKPAALHAARFIVIDARLQRAGLPALHQIPGDAPAMLHQLKIIQQRQAVLFECQRLDERAPLVIAQQQHMRQLDSRPLTDRHARRDALHDGLFRRAHGSLCARAVIIPLQIDHADHAPAHCTADQRALDVDKRALMLFKHALRQIRAHGGMNLRDALLLILRAELGLGQNQVQCRGRAFSLPAHARPVFRLGGKLIARHDSPLFHFIHARKQHVRRAKDTIAHLLKPLSLPQRRRCIGHHDTISARENLSLPGRNSAKPA